MMCASDTIWKLGTIPPVKGTNPDMPLESNFLSYKRRPKERWYTPFSSTSERELKF